MQRLCNIAAGIFARRICLYWVAPLLKNQSYSVSRQLQARLASHLAATKEKRWIVSNSCIPTVPCYACRQHCQVCFAEMLYKRAPNRMAEPSCIRVVVAFASIYHKLVYIANCQQVIHRHEASRKLASNAIYRGLGSRTCWATRITSWCRILDRVRRMRYCRVPHIAVLELLQPYRHLSLNQTSVSCRKLAKGVEHRCRTQHKG